MNAVVAGTDARSASGPPTSFRPFSKLPPELRWQIWQMAICTSPRPRIHYYSLFHTDKDGQRHSQLQQIVRDNPPPKVAPASYCSSGVIRYRHPPLLESRPDQFAWTRDHHFSYFWNAGLHMACHESRAALFDYHLHRLMEARLATNAKASHPDAKKKKRRRRRKEGEPNEWRYSWRYVSGPGLRPVQARDDQDQDICVWVSKDDIVCFRFAPEDIAACASSLAWEVLLTRLPMFHFPHVVDVNLALEYDASWNQGLGTTKEALLALRSEPSVRGLAVRAYWSWLHGRLPRSARMWLLVRDGQDTFPAVYRVGRDYEHVDPYFMKNQIYKKSVWAPQYNYVFVDGQDQYVECYMDNGRNVPAFLFAKRMKLLLNPTTEEYRATLFVPGIADEFFNVLRRLPKANVTLETFST